MSEYFFYQMILTTQIPLKKKESHLIDYQSNTTLIGSCFSKTIERFITNTINQKKYTENDLFFHNERWHCFDSHSSLSSSDKNDLLNNLNNAINSTFKQLHSTTHIIITLGTSWVYREITSDKIVANCHKVPQKKFLKELLSIDEIYESLDSVITLIKSINPKAKFIFTVSPVRHLKDGFIENTQSKSHLIAGLHQLINCARDDRFYFPSYEIMMDELRDYRFYKEDMIHPNQTAVNYIWEKFSDVWLSENTKEIMNKVAVIQKGLQHRSFNPKSEAHLKFLKNLEKKKETLVKIFPFIKF